MPGGGVTGSRATARHPLRWIGDPYGFNGAILTVAAFLASGVRVDLVITPYAIGRGARDMSGAREALLDAETEHLRILLSEREREVLVEIAKGATNAEISTSLYMAEGTVKTHIGRLLAKLHARDRVQLVLIAHEAGLVSR